MADNKRFGEILKDILLGNGADIVGYADLTGLPSKIRHGLPAGISIAVKYDKEIIRGIHDLPTAEYFEQYNSLNKKLDVLACLCVKNLNEKGYNAVAQNSTFDVNSAEDLSTPLPHKTVATKAGIGWIGKCALLVTEKYGSMIRLISVVTDAPLETAEPITVSKCGGCLNCTRGCPAGAVKGVLWEAGLAREEIYDANACMKEARKRSMQGFGKSATVCGKCIEVCPYTRRYLSN